MQFNPYRMNNNDVHIYISYPHSNESNPFDEMIRFFKTFLEVA